MRAKTTVSIVLLALLFANNSKATMQSAAGPAGIAHDLKSGALVERQAALETIKASPSLLKDRTIVAAIQEEFARYTDDERRWLKQERAALKNHITPQPPEASPLSSFDYETGLLTLMIDSKDPVFIPELTWATGNSGPAIDALGSFGDLALPSVIDRYHDRCAAAFDCPVSMHYGLLLSIARMFENGSLAPASREKALAVAREAIRSDSWEMIDGAISVVGASCDDDLRQQLASITSGPRRLAGVSTPQAESMRNRGERALQQCLKQR